MAKKHPTKESDLLDRLLEDWQRERPDLDPSPMSVVGRIIHLAGHLRTRAGKALQEFDLHYTDLDVLATLRRSGAPFRLTPTELSRSVLLTSGAMTAALRRLESKGFVSRRPEPKDGRIKAVELTGSGRRLIDKAIAVRFTEAEQALSGLGAVDRRQLAALLRTLSTTLDPAD